MKIDNLKLWVDRASNVLSLVIPFILPVASEKLRSIEWGRWGTDQVHTGKHASQPASSLSIARAVEKGLQASLRNSLTNCLGFLNSGLNNSFHIQDIQPRFLYYYITSGAIHK